MIRRIRYWWNRSRREEQLRAEIEQHIEEVAAELRSEGRTPEAALAEAMRRFGRTAEHQEAAREVWIARILSDLSRDTRYALRSIARNPGFAAVAILSAALGIAACTTVFGIVNFALFRPLLVADPASLLSITGMHLESGSAGESMSYGEVLDIRKATRSWQAVAAFSPFLPAGITAQNEARRHWGQLVSANYFDVVKPAFVAGGGFIDGEDDVPGAPGKIVLGHALWQSRFGGDPALIGRTILVNRSPMVVTGVTGPGFRGTEVGLVSEFFLPFSQIAERDGQRRETNRLQGYESQWLFGAGRLRPGVTETQARLELGLLANDIRARVSSHARDRSLYAERAGQLMHGFRRLALPAFLLLLTVTFLVLLTACANVANLMLARASARRQEIATRLAIGAGRGRLVRQLMTESLLLALAGGITGLVLTEWASRHISGFQLPTPMPFDLEIRTDPRVALFAAGLAAITGIVFGLVPALRASRPDLISAIKLDRTFGLRNGLVVAQVAISAVLVLCSGLFLRSLSAAKSIATGMDPENIQMTRFDPALSHYDDARVRQFLREVLANTEATTGVRAASVVNMVPLSLGGNFTRTTAEGKDPQRDGVRTARMAVAPRYFETMGIRILEGTDFSFQSGEPVVIVNEELARRLYPGQSAVGRSIAARPKNLRIAGVVANTKYRMVQEQETEAIVYYSLLQEGASEAPPGGFTLLVKTHGAPEALAPAIRQLLRSRDPQLVVTDAGTMEAHVTESMLLPRLAASLFGLCGGMGLLIASIGVYGVISFAVARRAREIGIRMALGAVPAQVVGAVLRRGMTLACVGIALGMGAGVAVARLARSLLVGVSTSDPLTFAGVPVVLITVALAAVAIPARRAAAIDPNRVLRTD